MGIQWFSTAALTKTNNSNPLDAVNNANIEMISAGIEYAKGNGDLTLLATKSDTNYASRGAALTPSDWQTPLFFIAST